MSSARRELRATDARRAREARETAETAAENFSGTRSARSASRTTGAQGDVLDRPRHHQSATRRVSITGSDIPIPSVASGGSSPRTRRRGAPMRTTTRTEEAATPQGSPTTTVDEVTSPITPRSNISGEGEDMGTPQQDADGGATEDAANAATDADGTPTYNPSYSDASSEDGGGTKQLPSTESEVDFATTSEGDSGEPIRNALTGDKRPRPERKQPSRKKGRNSSPNLRRTKRQMGQEIMDLRQTIREMERAYSTTKFQRRRGEPLVETGSDTMHASPLTTVPWAPESWGSTRTHGGPRSIHHRGDPHSLSTTVEDSRRHHGRSPHHHEGRHDNGRLQPPKRVYPLDDRRVTHQHPHNTHKKRVGRTEVATNHPRDESGTVEQEVTTDEGMSSFEDRSPSPPRTKSRRDRRVSKEPLGVVTLSSSGTDADSVGSGRGDSDYEDRRGRYRPLPKLEDLSKEQLIRELGMRRRQASTTTVDYMEHFAEQARKAKVRFRGTPPAKFALGTEPFNNFRDRYQAYALTSGWTGPQRVAAMLRFLDGRAAKVFNDWIKEGRFVKMDAELMWRMLQKRFCDPSEERQVARMELSHRLQQSGESILAYEQVFVDLAIRAELNEEEMVAQWVKNIDPQVANICRTHTAMQDLTFQQVAKIARRADRQTPDVQPPQVAIRRSVHAVSTTMQGVSDEGNPSPKTQSLSIQAIREAVKEELARERTSKQQEVEDTIGQLKRELSTLQVLQVQQDARADSRGPPPNKSRERGGGGGDRSARTQPTNDRVRCCQKAYAQNVVQVTI
jgi:hypothetical protein